MAVAIAAESPRDTLSFDEYLVARGLSRKTATDYLREIILAGEWFAAHDLEMVEALPSQLVAYAETRPNTPSIRGHMRAAFRYWWEWHGVRGWPDAIKLPKAAPMTCKALDDGDARAVMATARGWWREGTAVLCLGYLGLRNAELAGMRWDGFDSSMEWYTLVGKANRERTVPVHPDLVAELDGRRSGSPWMFEGRDGGPISHTTVWNWVRAVAREAGYDGSIWPHRIRHTTLAMMNDATGDLRTVQTFAGHARPETTAGYTRTTRARLRAASNALAW